MKKLLLILMLLVAGENCTSYGQLVEHLTITTAPAAYSAYTILNTLGPEIMANTITTPTTTIDVKGLAAGVYTITLRGAGGVKVEKWVKW
jgi:hypothetical protein